MLDRMLRSWCTLHRPDMLGCLWMTVLLGSLTWLDFQDGGLFLIPCVYRKLKLGRSGGEVRQGWRVI